MSIGATGAESSAAPPPQPAWGRIIQSTNSTGTVLLEVRTWPADGKLPLPTPFPNITAGHLISGSKRASLGWIFNADATQLHLEVPTQPPSDIPAMIELETAGNSAQFADGRIVFSALDARVQGDHAKLESHPGNHRIGFWTDPADSASWEFKPTRWGMYDLEITFSADGGDGTELRFDIAGQTFIVVRPSTGSWYRYQTMPIGRVYLTGAEPFTARASCRTLKGGAVMNLKAMTLRPAPEGKPIAQDGSGAIALLARDATTHSVLMRYEPATNKNCLGYWVNANDWAEWEFSVTKPGAFEVEVWQGCGKGQGGSDAEIEVAGRKLPFIVQETGRFQTFAPRRVGRVNLAAPGTYSLALRALRKQASAVMDVAEVRLIPVTSAQNVPPKMAAWLQARRVVFLGDSITYSGEYVEFIELYFRTRFPESRVEFLDLGLPSETVSGLSEPGHAGGAFPRPDLHERLERVLEKAKPDLLVACYGMNDGIYYPFSDERFQKFKDGVRRLRERAAATGAKVIHVTPPTFDPLPLKGRTLPAGLAEYRSPYEGYNEVLDRYSVWLLAQRSNGWEVVDAHDPMNRFLVEHRRADPNFMLARDGVHANVQGHWLMAREILRCLGAPTEIVSSDDAGAFANSIPPGPELLNLVQQRQRLLKDAWLTYVGHKRPGMNKGKPLVEAEREAGELDRKIHALAEGKPSAGGPIDSEDRSLPAEPKMHAAGTLPASYSIPIVDISSETNRQAIVDREPSQYLGHPTTVLLEDGKTMLVVYPKGHGRGAIVLKRSTDGGLTWSERLSVPENWATSLETPTIHRVVDAQGKKRLIVWSGLYPARLSVSEDDGNTWTPLKPVGDWGGIVVMGSVEPLRDQPGHYLALFHDDGRFFAKSPKLAKPPVMTLYQTESHDGGVTWNRPRPLFASSEIHLCEPGLIRSPDGKQLAVLLRENLRRRNSHVIFSNDEGRTWSPPRELPAALTGDRHVGKYAPDGRLFISFRDITRESATKGDWVSWVGTYEDIVAGREGQYRARIMHNTKDADCAYPGVEVLPDGTFVTTTYGHWTKDEPPYIVSVRFKLSELDAKLKIAVRKP